MSVRVTLGPKAPGSVPTRVYTQADVDLARRVQSAHSRSANSSPVVTAAAFSPGMKRARGDGDGSASVSSPPKFVKLTPPASQSGAGAALPPAPFFAARSAASVSASVGGDDDDWADWDSEPATPPAKSASVSPPGAPHKTRERGDEYKLPAGVGIQTPQQVRAVIEKLRTSPSDCEFMPEEQEEVDEGLAELSSLPDTPVSRKRAELTERAKRALFGNLAEGAEFGSLAYHKNGCKNVRESAAWVTDVIPVLRQISTACRFVPKAPVLPPHFWDVPHGTSAIQKKNSVVGLHFFEKDFSDKYVVHSCVENPATGVCGINFTIKGAPGAPKEKFSSIYPRCFASYAQVTQFIDATPILARAFNRELFCIRFKSVEIYGECFVQKEGAVKLSFPYLAFMHYEREKVFQLPAGKEIASGELLQMAKTALMVVRPEIVDQDSPLRYLIPKEDDMSLVIDLAPQVGIKVPSGIVFCVPASTFKDDDRLTAHIAKIIKFALPPKKS